MLLSTTAGQSFFQFLVVLFCFAAVLVLTYYVTRWIANYQQVHSHTKNLEIVEAIRVSTNASVQIIRAGEGSYYLIAVGKDEVRLLGKLSEEQLLEKDPSFQPVAGSSLDFRAILDKFKEGVKDSGRKNDKA